MAVRDGFLLLLPLTMLSVLAVVLSNAPWHWFDLPTWVAAFDWKSISRKISISTAGIMGLALAMAVGNRYQYALQSQGEKSIPSSLNALLCVVNFVAAVAPLADTLERSFGPSALLLGILVGVITVESLRIAYRLLPDSHTSVGLDGNLLFNLTIKQVLPSAVACLISLVLTTLLMLCSSALGQVLQAQVNAMAHGTGSGTVLNFALVLLSQSLWLVGIHGDNIVDMYAMAVLAAPTALHDEHLAAKAFINTFSQSGGSGATLGLLISILWTSKDPQMRRLGLYSIVPAAFNVNETLLFGLPIILNPLLALPFVLAPILSLAIAEAALYFGWLALDGAPVVWSTPIFVSGYAVSGGIAGALVQLLGVLVSVALYKPFLERLEARRKQRQVNALASAIASLSTKESTQQRVLSRADSLGDFARALSADFAQALHTHQVFQVYQPKHDASGRLTGVEALLRWTHPEYGSIAPSAIINVAEESRLITTIGAWSLDQALAAQKGWQKAGLAPLKMAVNLSPIELSDPGYVPRLRALLAKHGIPPQLLELELTEGAAIPQSSAVNATLVQLGELGVQLSIDDFGMGYTSLMYLQRFQVSAIKIDGALTREIQDSPVLTDIVRTICDLGRQRSVRVVAEFVETAKQQALLSQLGCNEFQGYLYSPALSANGLLLYAQRRQ